MTVAQQGRMFAAALLCGICIGMANDLLGVLRRGFLMTAAADLLLGAAAAACITGAGLRHGCSSFRLHVFLGAAAGWALYSVIIGMNVRFLRRKCLSLSKKVKKQAKNGA